MFLKESLLVGAGLLVGALVGISLSGSELKGRLGACKDITSALNEAIPLELSCEVAEGDVWITSPLEPGRKVSLDGKREI